MSRTNLERATHAQAACDEYGSLVGMTLVEDRESLLGDLLADMLHLAVRLNIDPDRVVRLGQMHFTEEQEEET
jgi:hypothetical protein